MKEIQRLELFHRNNEKFKNDLKKVRSDLGLSCIFKDQKDFDDRNKYFSNFTAAAILKRKDSRFSVEVDFITEKEISDKVDEFLLLYKRFFSPTPQNKRIIRELLLFDKANFDDDEAWPPLEIKADLKKKKGKLYFSITKKARRDDFIDNWDRNKQAIDHYKSFLSKSTNDKKLKLKSNKKRQIVELYIFADTNKTDIKNQWSEIEKLQQELEGFTKKSKKVNSEMIKVIEDFDNSDKIECDDAKEEGGTYRKNDGDLAEILFKSDDKKHRHRIHQQRYLKNKLDNGE